jgi:hypothetical protein
MAQIKSVLHRLVAYIVSVILRPGAIYDPRNFALWQGKGYHITPVHFYSPIPDTRDLLSSRIWNEEKEMVGVNMNPDSQLKLLRDGPAKYEEEFSSFVKSKTAQSLEFSLGNDTFANIDPFVLYGMVRHIKPRTIIEIGSGCSTVVSAEASRRNGHTRLVCIDPYPDERLLEKLRIGFPTSFSTIGERVENVELDVFQQLCENDILFIDSTHTVRTGGDVTHLYLEVIPRLSKGVIIHCHDILFPNDYSKDMVINQNKFWTEQYLLHAFLLFNSAFEVLFASHYMGAKYPNELRAAFPNALGWGGGSFWMQKTA